MNGPIAEREAPGVRADYVRFLPIGTRWSDNDAYGHVNNVVYYAWFDSVVNRVLISDGGLDIAEGDSIGLCVESGCRYHAPVAYPEDVTVGLRVGKLGRSSVRYELGVFVEGRELAAAEGHFVHVFVARASRRPVPLPPRIAAALAPLVRGVRAP